MAAIDKSSGSLRWKASAAAATLLGLATGAQGAKASSAFAGQSGRPAPTPTELAPSPSLDLWTWDTAFLQYNESQRIAVSEPQIGLRRDFAEGRAFNILATVDVISGNTPLGTLPLTPATVTNTVTGPSGKLVNPDIGKVPTSYMFDTRIGLNASYERPSGPASSQVLGAEVAKEHDFLSTGVNFTQNFDFNQKNTTFSFGASPEYDIVSPHGGLPYAYGIVNSANEFQGTEKSKIVVGGLLGLTQVINRRTLMQWNFSPTYENGYLNDPYKQLSLYDAQGNPLAAIHENRPNNRFEQSYYWLTRYNFTGLDVFSLGLRYFVDSWGIHSQTIDFTYRWQFHERRYFEPHVRYYHQTQADFFRVGLPINEQPPPYASADYRLNQIDGVTFGAHLGLMMRNDSELILRAEYYWQTGERRPATAPGQQKQYDLFPTLDASILQIEYRFQPAKWKKKSP